MAAFSGAGTWRAALADARPAAERLAGDRCRPLGDRSGRPQCLSARLAKTGMCSGSSRPRRTIRAASPSMARRSGSPRPSRRLNFSAMRLDGTELTRLPTPGAGKSGAHGLEWIDGKLWVTVPPSATTYELDPASGAILRQFPAPGNRPHGLAWDGNLLWVAETTAPHDHRLHAGRRGAARPRDGPRPRPKGPTRTA